MKVFYLLISCVLVTLASSQEVWYGAEGNVVRVLDKAESSSKLPEKEPLFKDAYQWDARQIWRKSPLRGRAIYSNSPYVFGSGFGYRNWAGYYRSHYGNGGSYQSYCRPIHYRGSSLNIVFSR